MGNESIIIDEKKLKLRFSALALFKYREIFDEDLISILHDTILRVFTFQERIKALKIENIDNLSKVKRDFKALKGQLLKIIYSLNYAANNDSSFSFPDFEIWKEIFNEEESLFNYSWCADLALMLVESFFPNNENEKYPWVEKNENS
jgi:hypothetical protein